MKTITKWPYLHMVSLSSSHRLGQRVDSGLSQRHFYLCCLKTGGPDPHPKSKPERNTTFTTLHAQFSTWQRSSCFNTETQAEVKCPAQLEVKLYCVLNVALLRSYVGEITNFNYFFPSFNISHFLTLLQRAFLDILGFNYECDQF